MAVTTSRFWPWAEWLAVAVLMALAAPMTMRRLSGQGPAELTEGLSAQLVDRAVLGGVIVGVVLAVGVAGCGLIVVTLVERRLAPLSLRLPRGLRIGPLHLVVCLCGLLPLAVTVLACSGQRPRAVLMPFSLVVAAAVLWSFRGGLRQLPRRRVLLIAATCLGLAGLLNL
jgi:hypothetical protein